MTNLHLQNTSKCFSSSVRESLSGEATMPGKRLREMEGRRLRVMLPSGANCSADAAVGVCGMLALCVSV